MKLLMKAVTIASAIVASPALATSWTLDPEGSHLAYGSIKKDVVGEVNSFTNLSGHVGPDGKVEIEIDLSSVETNIDIRNERMIEYVFRKAGTAILSAEFDMQDVAELAVGGTTIVDAEAVPVACWHGCRIRRRNVRCQIVRNLGVGIDEWTWCS